MAARDISRPPPGWEGRKPWREYAASYRKQILRAHERGYAGSVFAQREARRTGKRTPSDIAQAAQQRARPNRYITELGRNRWTFVAVLYPLGALGPTTRLQRNVGRAARLDLNITASLVFGEPKGSVNDAGRVIDETTGEVYPDAKAGFDNITAYKVAGKGGQSAASILEEGDGDALAGLLALLGTIYGPAASGVLIGVSLYVFPVARRNAA